MGEYDDLIAAVKQAPPPSASGSTGGEYDDLIAAAKASAPAEQRSFLAEAGHRAADAGRGFVENVKNIPSTSGARVWENLKALGHPFAEAGREVVDEAAHPVRTFQGGPLARWTGMSTPEAEAHHDAVNRELVRGAQSNVPLAGLAHERLTGFPESSPEDEAMAPHAAGAGQVAGMAALALAPKVAPAMGRVVGSAGNIAQDAVASASEASLARSAARYASSPTPVRDAFTGLAKDVTEHGMRHGILSLVGHSVGGSAGAAIGTGLSLAKPVWRAAVTAADEGLARIARRVSETRMLPAMEAEAPSLAEAADAENAAHLERIRNADGAIEMGPVVHDIAKAVDPKIAVLEDGLAGATPAQAKAIKAAIEGIKARAERLAGREALAPQKIAPSLAERAAETRSAPLRLVEPVAPSAPPEMPVATVPTPAPPAVDPSLVERAVAAGKNRPTGRGRPIAASTTGDSSQSINRLVRWARDGKTREAIEAEAARLGTSPKFVSNILRAYELAP